MKEEKIRNLGIKIVEALSHPSSRCVYESNAGEVAVLLWLESKGDLTPGCLSECCHMSSAHVAKTLAQLENKKEIIRKNDQNDHRKIIVSLTEAGKERSIKHMLMLEERFKKLFGVLNEEEIDSLLSIITKLKGGIENDSIKEYN